MKIVSLFYLFLSYFIRYEIFEICEIICSLLNMPWLLGGYLMEMDISMTGILKYKYFIISIIEVSISPWILFLILLENILFHF